MCSWICGGIKRFNRVIRGFNITRKKLQEIQKGSLALCVLARPRCTQGVLMFPENNQFLQRQGISVLKIACVAWRFWLGALSNKGGRGQRNREEIGFYFFIFLAAFVHPALQSRHATQASS